MTHRVRSHTLIHAASYFSSIICSDLGNMIAALTSNQINKYTINSSWTGAGRLAAVALFVSRAFPAILLFSGHIDVGGGEGEGEGGHKCYF